MGWKSITEANLSGQIVLVRVDINVPFENGAVSDFTRIDRIRPTIDHIQKAGGRAVLLAHFGRPKGQAVAEMSLEPIAAAMAKHWGRAVKFSAASIGAPAKRAIDAMGDAVLVLENTRFHAGEEKNDPILAAEFAALGDIYCNDAFSAAHRAHASTAAIAHILPAYAGLLMAEELGALEAALSTPKHPVTAVVGGAKISTKLDLIGNLIAKTDYLVIGGGMANTFLAALGHPVGKSLVEPDLLPTARAIMDKAAVAKCEIVLPVDIVCASAFAAHAPHATYPADACPPEMMILDAGAASIEKINAVFAASKTLVWNGPLGAFELAPFDAATNATALHAARLSRDDKLLTVAGGGDTVAALNASGAADDFDYISTAGGAFLEWLEGKTLPGVAALDR